MNLKNVEISIGLLSTNSSYLCLRRKKKPFYNYIEFPGGKKRTNETSIQCLKRELKEELNIEVLKFKYLSTIKHCYDDVLIIINVFTIFRYKGNIKSKSASLGGKIKGNVSSDQINIRKTADVDGVLNQKSLSIEEGATLKIKAQTYK